MNEKQILAILNGKTKIDETERYELNRWQNLYFGMSLHTSGACPAFVDLSNKPLQVPVSTQGYGSTFTQYGNYLNRLSTLGFDYNGLWIFPPGYQGVEYQFIFDRIIYSRHPRENEQTRQWRFSQHVPITKYPCGMLNEVVTGAIFQDSNYRVEVDDKDTNEYIYGNNFMGYDLIGYFANILYKAIVEDANGYVLRIPKKPFYEQKNGKPEVDIWFVHSKDLFLPPTEDEMLFRTKSYAWYVNRESIWRFKYNRGKNEYFLAPEDSKGYYAHMLGYIPATKAGGEWNTHGYWESYYYKAKPLMDEFLRAFSQRQLVDKEASTPVITELSVDCPECHGTQKVQIPCAECTGGYDLVDCGTCHGSGTISRNPGEHLIIPKSEWKDVNPGIYFTNPDTAVNKNARETVKEMMDMILEALHLNKQKTDTVQSGLAKAIDQERLYKFISTISNDLFDKHLPDTVRDIIAYRTVTSENGTLKPTVPKESYTIQKPTQFAIRTAQDLLTEYKTAFESNMPKVFLERKALDYADKEYNGDAVYRKKVSYICYSDPLFAYSTADITSIQATLAPEQIVYHNNISLWIDEIIQEKTADWFVQASYMEIDKLAEVKESEYEAEYGLPETQPENTEVVDVNKEVNA